MNWFLHTSSRKVASGRALNKYLCCHSIHDTYNQFIPSLLEQNHYPTHLSTYQSLKMPFTARYVNIYIFQAVGRAAHTWRHALKPKPIWSFTAETDISQRYLQDHSCYHSPTSRCLPWGKKAAPDPSIGTQLTQHSEDVVLISSSTSCWQFLVIFRVSFTLCTYSTLLQHHTRFCRRIRGMAWLSKFHFTSLQPAQLRNINAWRILCHAEHTNVMIPVSDPY